MIRYNLNRVNAVIMGDADGQTLQNKIPAFPVALPTQHTAFFQGITGRGRSQVIGRA